MLMSANQGIRTWYQCYHSTKYPVTTFVHLDDVSGLERMTSFEDEPNANSTMINPNDHSSLNTSRHTFLISHDSYSANTVSNISVSPRAEYSHGVGHITHIPRTPPIQTTYTMPSIVNKSIGTEQEEDLFGMIKLKENDVCYTSGTIEWVGKKRSFPINSGFKILHETGNMSQEPLLKKVRTFNNTFTSGSDKMKDCNCADVLPTVNAIVDHLNALHEAVDLVDLRLNTLEDTFS